MRRTCRNCFFSEIYDVQIQVFDSLAAQHPIVRITTAEGSLTLSLLFSGDHYDWLMPKFEGDQEPEINHIVIKEDLENKKPPDLKQIIRENRFPNDYSTKYTDGTLSSILNYLKDGKYPESIESLRKSKNEIVISNESTRKQKMLLQSKFYDAKRHFRQLAKKETGYRITEFELNSRKYTSLLRNWSHTNKPEEVIENEDCINQGLKRRSNSFVDKDLESLDEWLIVPFEWQILIIIYDCHTKQGSHLKIEPT